MLLDIIQNGEGGLNVLCMLLVFALSKFSVAQVYVVFKQLNAENEMQTQVKLLIYSVVLERKRCYDIEFSNSFFSREIQEISLLCTLTEIQVK